jgi:hypothetical protein
MAVDETLWEYDDDRNSMSVWYLPGGELEICAVGREGHTTINMPYEEFVSLYYAMREHRMADLANRDASPDIRLVRSVLALSGMEMEDLARLLGTSTNAVVSMLGGGRMSERRRRALLRAQEVFGAMVFDPHFGRRRAIFEYRDGTSVYAKLLAELHQDDGEPIQGPGYTPEQLLGAEYD